MSHATDWRQTVGQLVTYCECDELLGEGMSLEHRDSAAEVAELWSVNVPLHHQSHVDREEAGVPVPYYNLHIVDRSPAISVAGTSSHAALRVDSEVSLRSLVTDYPIAVLGGVGVCEG